MRKLTFFTIFLLLWVQAATAESIITVEVNESGNAWWTMEKRTILTKPELNEMEGLIKTGQNISNSDIAEFKEMINRFVQSAQNFSNRSMEVGKFNISYDTVKTISGGYGIIRYSFKWKNFSHTESDMIFVGDAFSEGMALSSDTVLVIQIPDGYEVKSISPNFDRQDGNRLIWDGSLYHSFERGEPALVLSPVQVLSPASIEKDRFPILVVSLVILISGISVIFWKRRKISKENNGQPEDEIVPASIPDFAEIDLGDEELIEKFLIRSGGQAYQSDIVKDIGFSKSKISIVLAKMKEEGRILKIRKGKENIIRLAVKKT